MEEDVDMKSADYITQNNCYQIVDDTESGTVVNPKGTVYLEANSATGSKFYNLIASKQDLYFGEKPDMDTILLSGYSDRQQLFGKDIRCFDQTGTGRFFLL